MQKQKVLLLVTDLYHVDFHGGIQIYNRFLWKALGDLGCDYFIISMNDNMEDIKSEKIIGCSRNKMRFIWEVIKQNKFFKPNLIICGHVNFSPLCMYLQKIAKVSFYTICYGIDIWNMSRTKIKAVKSSKKIITISEYTKGKIQSQTNCPDDRFVFLFPSLDTNQFVPKERSKDLMAKWNLQPEDRIVLTIARLSKSEQYKGYDTIISIFKKVIEKIPHAKYVIGGKGNDMERIKSLIEQEQLQNKIILAGFIPDEEIIDYYNLCDVFAMPSKGEGFGIVFLEAACCGKPVICGNKDGAVDATLQGDIAMLVDPDEPEQIAQALITLFENKAEQKLYDAKYLRDKVITNYGYDCFKERLKNILAIS